MAGAALSVRDSVLAILVDALGIESPDLIQDGQSLVDDLGAEGHDLLDILFRCERQLGAPPLSEAEKYYYRDNPKERAKLTVGDLVSRVENRLE